MAPTADRAPTMRVRPIADFGHVAVREYQCHATPADPSELERHQKYSLSFVSAGSFGCQAHGQHHELVPGCWFVGRADDEYRCTHDHRAGGDRCVSFQFVADEMPDLRTDRKIWRSVALAPRDDLTVLVELARSITEQRSDVGLDELAHELLARFTGMATEQRPWRTAASVRDRRRVIDVALALDATADRPWSLRVMAAQAARSPYHFLRTFRHVVGLTPHQYLIQARLRRAMQAMQEPGTSVTGAATAAGFNDLSNFVRRFHRVVGLTPGEYLRQVRGRKSTRSKR